MAAHDAQVRHAHWRSPCSSISDRRYRHTELVGLALNLGQEPVIDAEDDLEMAWQHLLHQRHRAVILGPRMSVVGGRKTRRVIVQRPGLQVLLCRPLTVSISSRSADGRRVPFR